jgi:hypothetical protein
MMTRLGRIRQYLQNNDEKSDGQLLPPLVDFVIGYLLDGLGMAIEWLDACREGDLTTIQQLFRIGNIVSIPFTDEEYNTKVQSFIRKGMKIDQSYYERWNRGKSVDKDILRSGAWCPHYIRERRYRENAHSRIAKHTFMISNGSSRAVVGYPVINSALNVTFKGEETTTTKKMKQKIIDFMIEKGLKFDTSQFVRRSPRFDNPHGFCRVWYQYPERGMYDITSKIKWTRNNDTIIIETLGTMLSATCFYHMDWPPPPPTTNFTSTVPQF